MTNTEHIKAMPDEELLEDDYKRGYKQALEDINKPMKVKIEKWEPTECPRCKHDFHDYEDCDDGYYKRPTSLERCPYCGQSLSWFED